MGITSYWDTLRNGEGGDIGECVNLFHIASDHLQRTGKPYRIAVDTPYWLFKNLDDESVQIIRDQSHRASNPNEKAILYRLMRFACHGIQVCLVFDGPGRPPKRGKALTLQSHNFIKDKMVLLKEAAQKLGVVCWEAPSEAEAECANMLCLGIVDNVWTEDSDVFMFGAETLLRFHYEKPGHKDNVMAMQYSISSVKQRWPNMDRRGHVLFAVLAGGDYAVGGLHGCGPKKVLEAVKAGFGATLVESFKRKNLQTWRKLFQAFLVARGSKISLPAEFPELQVLQKYIEPRVSDKSTLESRLLWDLPVDHLSLYETITTRFNFSVQEYIIWVVRMLVVRTLLAGPGSRVDKLELIFIRDVSTKVSGNIDMSRVSFLIGAIIPDRKLLDDWRVKDTIDQARVKPYVHQGRIECDIPDSIIKLAKPELLESKNVRKQKAAKCKAKSDINEPGRPRVPASESSAEDKTPGSSSLKRKRGRPTKAETGRPPVSTATDHRAQNAASDASRAQKPSTAHTFSDDDDDDDDFPDLANLGQQRISKTPCGPVQRQRVPLAETPARQIQNNMARSSGQEKASATAGLSWSECIELSDD